MPIPKVIHFIWAGGSFKMPQGNIETMAKWASRHLDFKLNLWVDEKTTLDSLQTLTDVYREEFRKAYQSLKHEGEVKETAVPDVLIVRDIRKEGICADKDPIIDYEIDRLDPNYGASSDVLRYRILAEEGGVYVDSDVEPGQDSLISVAEFGKGDSHVIYVDHLSQREEDTITISELQEFSRDQNFWN